jgi:uncharacterized protein YicC (UPF0701 family)
MPKIGLDKLKQIIREEMSRLHEGAEHDAAAKIMSGASKLLNAIESFKESSSEKVKADLSSHLEETEKILKRIVASPMQYVDSAEPVEKKVTLRSQKPDLV